jgi:hypothetical protein
MNITYTKLAGGGLGIIAVSLLIGFMLVLVMPPIDNTWDKKVALCDQAVTALLYSKDLVEITRAGIIVRYLECSISKRLP